MVKVLHEAAATAWLRCHIQVVVCLSMPARENTLNHAADMQMLCMVASGSKHQAANIRL